jgi:hypothetical protein
VNIYYQYISLSSHNEIHTHFSPKYDFIVTFSDNLRSVSVKGRDAQDVLDIEDIVLTYVIDKVRSRKNKT